MTKRRILKTLAISCGAVALTLVVVLASVVTWLALAGRAEWKAVQKSLIEKNEPMLLTELSPPSVRDEDNFFAVIDHHRSVFADFTFRFKIIAQR